MNRLFCQFLCVLPLLAVGAPPPIVTSANPSPDETLAAHEVRRYVYLRTGELLPMRTRSSQAGEACIFVARKDQPETKGFAGDAAALEAVAALKPQEYLLKKTGPNSLQIVGGDDAGVLYGAYAFAEKLGVRFYLHGDVVPDERIPFSIPELNERGKALFALRGIQPFHDFPEGPDWWNTDDYLAYIAQLAKMRMNFIGLHCYPEGRVGPEPLVWIGTQDEMDEEGSVKKSYPSFWANTSSSKEMWGYTPTKTSDFAGGASLLFAGDNFGNEVQAGLMPRPETPEDCNEVFNRTAVLLRRAFQEAKALGVKVCIGTETPLTIPAPVKEHLKSQGKNPEDSATVREIYEGMFARIKRAYPVDYYWLWTPEEWTWGGNKPEQFEATTRDIQTALDADKALGNPFTLATCGWVLGPQYDRAALDKFLPKDAPMSCINRQVGHDPVEPAFANIAGRPKWAIPWMENDPTLTQPQPWVGRMRYDAADARRLGCTGLLGIHWRTKAMMLNVSALAAAAWDQSWVPASFDPNPIQPQLAKDGALGGSVAAFTAPVAETDEAPIYQTVRYDVAGYHLAVPDGTYSVTLKFNEPYYDQAGRRVFGVKIQGRPVIETLDIFTRVGKNRALDFTFTNAEVTNGVLRIDFTPQVEFPCIAGIVIDGKTRAGDQAGGQPFTRKINCGGEKFKDYEADRVTGAPATAGKDRGMPVADFYADFAGASFGANVAGAAGAIMADVDGVKMPKITDWITGPGCIVTNGAPWEKVKGQFDFVERFAALREQVRGAGNLERFDYWLNTYRAAEAMARIGCARGELDRAAAAMKNEKDAARKKELAAEALAARVKLAGAWAQLLSFQTALTDTPGELGTIANLEMQSRRTRHLLDEYDSELVASLGAPLPAEATPSTNYGGAARIIVPTVRTHVQPGESLHLEVIVLDNQPAKSAALFWRRLGRGGFQKVNLKHVGRAVYSVALPAAKEDIEYYISARTASGRKLAWPASAPEQNQTVVLSPRGL
jgi:hypothetical protein